MSAAAIEGVLRRDRWLVVWVLLCLITLCWLYLLAGAGTGMYPHRMAAVVPSHASTQMAMFPVTWSPGYALLMLSMWWLMMIAMMLPSAAPMVLVHAALTRRGIARVQRPGTSTGVSATTAFIAGYLVVWGVFSLAAVISQWTLERGELLTGAMTLRNPLLGSALLLAAGVWQLSPLKTLCLRHCRSPISFLSAHWRPGPGGAFRMGVTHGVFCLGCCWLLMALLFYAGVMNLAWIAGLALYVVVEKVTPAGVAGARITGLLLIAWGVRLGVTAC